MYKKVRGMRDIYGEEVEYFKYISEIAENIFSLYGYNKIIVPIIEKTELFQRGVGEDTDVVEKEMYSFQDKSGRNITLRPEGTAGVVRSYIENGQHKADPVQKYYYIGPMFRYEKPQKGRYRQFFQIGVEVFGIKSPLIDVEIIYMLIQFLKELGLDNLKVNLNNMGCGKCRKKYIKKLKKYMFKHKSALCDTCQRRLESNPLRILDCKKCGKKQFIKNTPRIIDNLCDSCLEFNEKLMNYIEEFKIPYSIDHSLVRGLDYYTNTVFEIIAEDLDSSQNQIVGGGRYNDLVSTLGGVERPGLGFAFGFDRLVDLVMEKELEIKDKKPSVFIAWYLNDKNELLKFANKLRSDGIKIDFKYKQVNFSNQLRYADKNNFDYVIFYGEKEMKSEDIHIKNMKSGEEKNIKFKNLKKFIK